jgi:hypothetical protein
VEELGISTKSTLVKFRIYTSEGFAMKNLKLGCVINGTCTTVYSSNTIAFEVIPCILSGLNPT